MELLVCLCVLTSDFSAVSLSVSGRDLDELCVCVVFVKAFYHGNNCFTGSAGQ